MKHESQFLINAYDYLLITDLVTERSAPYVNALYQCLSGPIDFYDYVNYYLTGAGTPGATYIVTLNGADNTVSGLTLHVPNLQTTQQQGILSALVQWWLMVDSLDVEMQVKIHGTNLLQLSKDQTYLTGSNAAVNGYTEMPHYSYGTDFIPQLVLTNTSSAIIASTGTNQGIQIWGNRYQISQVTDQGLAKQIFEQRRFTPITVVPPRF